MTAPGNHVIEGCLRLMCPKMFQIMLESLLQVVVRIFLIFLNFKGYSLKEEHSPLYGPQIVLKLLSMRNSSVTIICPKHD